jgi:hypothetical protein
MDLNCGTSQCLYYIFLTIIGVIGAAVLLDILLYFSYSYFVVRRYYSSDLEQWKKRELSKYGAGGGYIGQKWEEVFAPEGMKMTSFAANTDSIFGIEKGEVYTCKKPCNGTSDDTFWTKVSAPSKIDKIFASDNGLWAISADGTPLSKNNGKWNTNVPFKGKFTNISADGKWGVKDSNPYKCDDMVCTLAEIPTVTVKQVINGQFATWAVTNGGEIYGTGKDNVKWILISTPAPVKHVAVGSADELYIVTEENLYVSDDATLTEPKWVKIPDAPKFVSLIVNKDIYGIDVNGNIWRGA